MKLLLTTLLLFSFISSSQGQTFGNEWINYNQRYFAFPIAQDGIYKIDYATLQANGVPLTGYSSSRIQLHGRGEEIPLMMIDGGDNSFDPGDYFLFIAKGNDGWLDKTIVPNQAKLANPGYSLISDTVFYYYTWGSGIQGKRFSLTNDPNYNSYAPVNYVEKTIYSKYSAVYADGYKYDQALGSIYSDGEGYGLYELGSVTGSFLNISIPTPQPYLGNSFSPRIEIRSSANSNANSTGAFNHHLKVGIGANNTVIVDTSFNNYRQIIANKTLSINDLSANSTNMKYEIIGDVGAAVDRQILTYFELTYPRLTNANGTNKDEFQLSNNPNAIKSRIDLQNLTAVAPIAFSFGTQNIAQKPFLQGGNWTFLVPNTTNNTSTSVFVFDTLNVPVIPVLKAVNGTGSFVDYTISSTNAALLLVYHTQLQQAAMDYAAYRQSVAGGSNNVILANIEDLKHQFGGGVPHHPAAIRRFASFIYNNSNNKPTGLFLLGKGYIPTLVRTNPTIQATNLIPTFGNPSSDNALTSNLDGTLFEPLIPTGRIAAKNNQELADYLAKVIQYEQNQHPSNSNFSATKDEHKQILHFVGGSNASQQTSFQGYMNGMKSIIEDSVFAGNVTSYIKTSSNPLDPNVVAGVTSKIQDGVSIMNFFGHAAASNNGFEINIDEASNWENQGKYPFVIGNSCYNGELFKTTPSTSERTVLIPNEGAIGFLSSVFIGYDAFLAYYTTELYKQIAYKSYGKSIGYQIQQTIKSLQQPTDNLILESTYSQMVYHGDPTIKINYSTDPEIEITPQQLSFSPAQLNLSIDSIQLDLQIKNLGTSILDTITIEVKRNFPGTSVDSVYNFQIPLLHYQHSFSAKFPLQPAIGIGVNQFTISVDIPSNHQEQYEEITNNSIVDNFFISIDGINPVWPYNYAVIPTDTVTVKASTINPIAPLNTYFFELDTTDTYDSPQLRRFSMTELGGVKHVKPNQWKNALGNNFPLICSDSTVYFWRVAVDSSSLQWKEFSFQYIPGKTGWGQDHFFQFKNNSFSNISYNRPSRLREFPATESHTVTIDAFDTYNSYYSLFNAWLIDGSIQEYATCGTTPYVYVGVINPSTLIPWSTYCPTGTAVNNNQLMNFGNQNNNCGCRNRTEKYFMFKQNDATQMAALKSMLETGIPDGHYVVVYTPFLTMYSQWDNIAPQIYTTFQAIGAPQLNNTQEEKPFALFFKKGTTTETVVKLWPQDTIITAPFPPKLNLNATIFKPDYIGLETTPFIGPATNWQTIYWRRDSLESPATDSVRLYIQGYDLSGSLLTTIDTLFHPNDSITNLNSLLSANNYPLMKLGVYYYDIANTTPAQVDRLHVLYSPIPEAAIDGTNAYYLAPNNDTIVEGQSISFAVDVKNISTYPMDSLLVNYWVEDAQNVLHPIPYPRKGPLTIGQTIRDTISFSSNGLVGQNTLWMEVNPYVNGATFETDQPEQYHFNNLLQQPIYVNGDDKNPILDVTFNGKHILNGDIIDPTSDILITLKDENEYLIMNDISDTTLFGVYLTDPAGVQKRIPFIDGNGNTIMQWIPADSQSKKFKIMYPIEFLLNGKYMLMVQGSDRSGNLSGDFEYRVTFEVNRESAITQMMNYPNPFSTKTHFVFTLTGTEVPDDILIQIMTVSGKVVKEINEEELGQLEIGRNVTSYAWDGKDNFGDPLANGVYLYRVRAKINGEEIKRRASGADSYFKEEFGKMYLFR